jgi:hypothetical protein
MASQSLVPLPNLYYGATMKWLDASGVKSGKALAQGIVQFERGDMYYSYTLVNNRNWKKWNSLFNTYTQSIQEGKIELKRDSLLTISYSTDLYFDLESLLKSIRINGGIPSSAQALIHFTNNQLIENLYLSPDSKKMKGYSGISILTPFKNKTGKLALQKLPTYQEFQRGITRLKK